MRRTIGILAIALLPTIAFAQDSTGTQDTTRRGTMQQGERMGTAHGRRMSRRSSMGLSTDQIRQLQQALNGAGCDAGTVDGRMGPHTRQAMACARQKNNITGSNPNDLFRALNLGFTTADSTGMGSMMRSGSRMKDSTGTPRGRRPRGSMRDSSGAADSSGLNRPNSIGSDTAGVTGRHNARARSTTGRTDRGQRPTSGLRRPNRVGSDTAGVSKTKKPPR